MNTSGTEYGSYALTNKHNFQCLVTNPITKIKKHLGCFKTEIDAENAINDWNFEFFSEQPWALPRCISLDRRDKNFVFSIHLRGKSIRVCSAKSLDEVVNQKLLFINKMI